MTTSKTIDLSVKTQQQTVELLTDRLNKIQNKVVCLINIISTTSSMQNCLHVINTNTDMQSSLFSSNDIETISKKVSDDISDIYSKLIDLQDFADGFIND